MVRILYLQPDTKAAFEKLVNTWNLKGASQRMFQLNKLIHRRSTKQLFQTVNRINSGAENVVIDVLQMTDNEKETIITRQNSSQKIGD